jgi:hypothetical protein
MTKLKNSHVKTIIHCHYWTATSWTQSLVLVVWKALIISADIEVYLVMDNIECDCYVGQLKDVDFIVTVVRLSKLHVCLCWFYYGLILFKICEFLLSYHKLLFYLFCTASGSWEWLRYRGNNLPDYTMSCRKIRNYEYWLQSNTQCYTIL